MEQPDAGQAKPASRIEAIHQWTKRTQEMLAHRAIKGLKFHRLYGLLRTKRLVWVALDKVLRSKGANTPGIDRVTKRDLLDPKAQAALVDEINRELCSKTYRPLSVRRVYVSEPGKAEKRSLGIVTIRDKIVQEMLRLVLEPIYEAKFHKHSYGFRPFRSTHYAALRSKDLIGRRGYNWVIKGNIRGCFDHIQQAKLLKVLRKTIKDERIIRLVKAMLKAGCMEDGGWRVTDEGIPQGGIASPLLANIYLNELDWYVHERWEGRSPSEKQRIKKNGGIPCFIVRYANDFLMMVKGTREQAERLKAEVAEYLEFALSLELSDEKTLITSSERGFDFLGFNIRKYRTGVSLITPSRKAMVKFRAKVKQLVWEGFSTGNKGGAIEHLNGYIIGWGMYYRRVSSARAFKKADHYVWWRVFRTSRRILNHRATPGQHYKANYIPYRFDIRKKNRRRRGKHYGAWADEAHTQAYIVVNLAFIPIRYLRFHPQLNPYVPEERAKLEKWVGTLDPHPDHLHGPVLYSDYGPEWDTLRKAVLEKAGHKCQECGKPIQGRQAHVHHLRRLRTHKSRKQANKFENLAALCQTCHNRVERRTRGSTD
jgi:RNA-directed DNA polymerase